MDKARIKVSGKSTLTATDDGLEHTLQTLLRDLVARPLPQGLFEGETRLDRRRRDGVRVGSTLARLNEQGVQPIGPF